jgi:Ca2+-binding RTX toxin-like protein
LDSLRNIEALKFSDRTVVIETSGVIRGTIGDEHLQGTSGDDVIDGREGRDTVFYKGAFADFTITWTVDGWRIADQKTGTDRAGVDIVRNVENVVFSDGVVRGLGDGMALVGTNILRLTSPWPVTPDFSNRLTSGALNASQALVEIVAKAGATTSVATLAYEFFTGKIPSQAGIDYLVSPTGPNSNNLNSAYYQSFNLENRYINFAVNLGRDGEGKAAFAAKYAALSLFDATREAYRTIFGAVPTDAKIHDLIDTRVIYFASYGGDGQNGIGTKAAMVGWLLAEAQKADLGVMVRANDAWLTDLADGSAPFAIDILDTGKGYWKADFIFGGT